LEDQATEKAPQVSSKFGKHSRCPPGRRSDRTEGELLDEAFAEAAGAEKADLESQFPHTHDHAKPTEKDGKIE